MKEWILFFLKKYLWGWIKKLFCKTVCKDDTCDKEE